MNKSLLLSILLIFFLAACSGDSATEDSPRRADGEPTVEAPVVVEATEAPPVRVDPTAVPQERAAPTAEPQAAVEPTSVPQDLVASTAGTHVDVDGVRAADLFFGEMLANMSYSSAFTADGLVPLSDGHYREAQAAGSAAETAVALTDYVSFGELDGQPLAAVVLVSAGADGGSVYSLHIVGLEAGAAVEQASATLEGGEQVDSMFIANDQVTVELLALGAEDALCCPTDLVVQTYQLHGDDLLQTANQVVGNVPGALDAALFGRVWTGRERFEPQGDSDTMAGNAGQSFLILHEDGTYQHAASCGASAGSFTAAGPHSITFRPDAGSPAACGSAADGDAAAEPLDEVVAYYYGDDLLSLIGEDGSTVYAFTDGTTALPVEGVAAIDAATGLYEEVQSEAVEEALAEDSAAEGAGEPGSSFDLVQRGIDMSVDGVASTWEWRLRPDRPDPQEAGGEIHPSHIMITFDNESLQDVLAENGRRLLIYPVQPYIGFDEAAGRSAVSEQAGRLRELIDSAPERQEVPQGGMPLLPPPNSLVEGWREFRDLDFVDGKGVRYMGRMPVAQDGGAEAAAGDAYYYQGLTADGRYYVSLWWPLLPGEGEPDLALLDEMVGTVAIGQ